MKWLVEKLQLKRVPHKGSLEFAAAKKKWLVLCGIVFIFSVDTKAFEPTAHFSDWKIVPDLIDSISKDNFHRPLELLHQLTWIKLGYPQISRGLNEEDHIKYMLQAKINWQEWWKDTGEGIHNAKSKNLRVDRNAFELSSKFLGGSNVSPEAILPVWIPKDWTLYMSFENGLPNSKEKELWILEKSKEHASLTKLRAANFFGKGPPVKWDARVFNYDGISPKIADRVLKAIVTPITMPRIIANKILKIGWRIHTMRHRTSA